MSTNYLMLEVRRSLRSIRFLVLALALPVVLFLVQANLIPTGDDADRSAAVGGIMVNMMAFGVLAGAVAGSGRLAFERASGWQRQLRLTPLSGFGYLSGKAVAGLLVSLPVVVVVALVGGLAEGVTLDPSAWLRLLLGSWLGAIPFVLLGLLIGQLGTPETMQPLNMLVIMTMGLLGGLWVPFDILPSWLQDVSPVLPSYWLIQLGRTAVTSDPTTGLGTAAAVLGAWTVVLAALVARRYRADGARS